ncbi:AMP-binding protein [Actinocorallia sp. A-T 12471]|uniref:AMP-binding protein n=1 Tax=Actinocorallia sp. A-T 12471 TaxID=3089813 RepID=UPI0029CF3E86|nr:AMP-binding protein [Actinocorallia sp. A-T 12471]MDX6741484.1 AMP-binding protein [Actinocorallia sp. A-T 12471]
MRDLQTFTLADISREHSRSWPERTAAVCGDQRHTYLALDDRVNRLANALAVRGVREGDRVLWLGQNCHRLVEGMLATAKLKAGFCPVNWRQSVGEFGHVIEDLAPAVVLWQSQCEVADTLADVQKLHGTAVWIDADTEYERILAESSAEDPLADDDDLAPTLFMYTAAFSGRPRAAMLSHRGLIAQNLTISLVQGITPEFVFLNTGPLFHIATMMTTLATLHMAGTNVYTPRNDAVEFCRLIDAEKVTGAFLIPHVAKQMARANAARKYDLSSLRTVPMGDKDFQEMTSRADSPWMRKPGGYGQTEVCGMLTLSAFGDAPLGPGRPTPMAGLRILDESGREVPHGETGEIAARGPVAMLGYWNDPRETSRRQDGGWHRTHDLGRREPDGTVTFIGPKTELIKTGVENVYPAEVEQALSQHPSVAESIVIGVPDPQWDQSVKAVVKLHAGAEATAEELIAHVKSLLASYKKPRTVAFVSDFPRLDSGWVDRDAVRAAHGAGGTPGRGV